ncbi:MAG: Lacal_2735 family protein [Verrucomicrobia bacterium]|nr:Lacal_2735 family protein [Verrucomicrobiota bacterium]MCH8512061.1 DUF6435 family protein [Kiritimatiellia bacterium]
MTFFSKKPEKKLRKEYEALMKQAMDAQRGGNIVKSSELHEKAAEVLKKIETMESSTG